MIMSSYPVAYRKGSRGSQRIPARYKPKASVSYLPKAAANDTGHHIRQRLVRNVPATLTRNPLRYMLPVARFAPYVGAIMTAAEIGYLSYDLYNRWDIGLTEVPIVPPPGVPPIPIQHQGKWRRVSGPIGAAGYHPDYAGIFASSLGRVPPSDPVIEGQAVAERVAWANTLFTYGFWYRRTINGSYRYAHRETWIPQSHAQFPTAPTTEIVETVVRELQVHPQFKPSGLLSPMPTILPDWYSPHQLPFEKAPIPWELIPRIRPHPVTIPGQGRTGGYEIPSQGDPGPAPEMPPAIAVAGGGGVRTSNDPGALERERQKRKRRPQPRHRYKKPSKGEKEKKFAAARGTYARISRAAGTVTEGLDLQNAAWDAMPEHIRKPSLPRHLHGATPEEKSAWRRSTFSPQYRGRKIYEHYDEMDYHKFFENLIKNHIEDFVLGTASSKTTKATGPWLEMLDRPVGLETGPAF